MWPPLFPLRMQYFQFAWFVFIILWNCVSFNLQTWIFLSFFNYIFFKFSFINEYFSSFTSHYCIFICIEPFHFSYECSTGQRPKKLKQTTDLQRMNNKKTKKKEVDFWAESMILGFETATSYLELFFFGNLTTPLPDIQIGN